MHYLFGLLSFLSLAGLAFSLIKYCYILFGRGDPLGFISGWLFPWMLVGVWILAILTAAWLNKDKKMDWKKVLRGFPMWMQAVMYVIFGYAFVSYFFIKPLALPQAMPAGGRTPEALLGQSGILMALFAVATCIHYSAYRVITASKKGYFPSRML